MNALMKQGLVLALICWTFPMAGMAEGRLQHPYLLFKANEINVLRGRFKEPVNQPIRTQVLKRADAFLAEPGEADGSAASALTWAYILTGEVRYSDALLALYRNEWRVRGQVNQNVSGFEFTTKKSGYTAALAYDVLWPLLGEEDRNAFGAYLDQYTIFMSKPTHGWKNNIGLGYFSAVGMIALARLDENPDARAILAECLKRLKEISYPASILPHPDGAYPEGALYGDYMFLYLLPFIQRYEAITGDTRHELLAPPFFQNTHRMVETLTGGDGIWVAVYDSQPQNYGAAWTAILGNLTNNDLLRWTSQYYQDRILAEDGPGGEVTRSLLPAALYRKWDKPVEFPGLPTLAMLPSINTASMRSDRALKPGLMVTVRGFGAKEINMRGQHKDVGSFLLFARGENFLIDPGYYQPEADAHSLPQINGAAVQVRAPSPLLGDEQGDLRALVINPTAAYKKGGATPVGIQRTWVMAGDKAVVLLEDIKEPADVVSRLQAGFATELLPDQHSAVIQGKSSRLWLGAFSPESTLRTSGPLDFGKSWIYQKWAGEGKVAWHRIEVSYRNSPEEPLVWVFVPLTNEEGFPKVSVERGKNMIAVKIPGHPDVRFENQEGSWQVVGLKPQPGKF